jgi:hypothetical protein
MGVGGGGPSTLTEPPETKDSGCCAFTSGASRTSTTAHDHIWMFDRGGRPCPCMATCKSAERQMRAEVLDETQAGDGFSSHNRQKQEKFLCRTRTIREDIESQTSICGRARARRAPPEPGPEYQSIGISMCIRTARAFELEDLLRQSESPIRKPALTLAVQA